MGELFNTNDELDPLMFEKELLQSGYKRIAGLDEAGRGPLAGPVVAAAVILPPECKIPRLTDSKKLAPKVREELFDVIHQKAVAIGVGISDATWVDRINVLEATRRAMIEALLELSPQPDYLLIDALQIASSVPQKAIVKGDLRSHSIAAASVIAKVTRDRMMEKYHLAYPNYNFIKHKGYGTADHMNRIRTYGPSPIHRKTFRGVKEHCLD